MFWYQNERFFGVLLREFLQYYQGFIFYISFFRHHLKIANFHWKCGIFSNYSQLISILIILMFIFYLSRTVWAFFIIGFSMILFLRFIVFFLLSISQENCRNFSESKEFFRFQLNFLLFGLRIEALLMYYWSSILRCIKIPFCLFSNIRHNW